MKSVNQRQRRRQLRRSLTVLMTMSIALTGCALSPALDNYSADEPAVLRYADYAPATASGPLDVFTEELRERTEGRLDLEPYWGGSLLSSKDLPSGLRAGIADIGIFTGTQHPSEYPVTDWLAKTASLAEPEVPTGILQSYAAFAEFAYTSPAVTEQFDALGLKVLVPLHTVLNYDIICTSPITTLEDARGMRIRSGGPLWDGEMRAAGMIPVTVAIEETYEGLQRGIIDCAIANPRTAMTYGFWDIAKYYTSIPFSGINSQYVVMNKTSWDALSEEDQQILWETSFTWWAENLLQDGIHKYQEMYEVGPSEQGVTFLEADAELTGAVTDYQGGVLDSLAESAPSAVEDPQGEIDSYADRMAYWLDVVEGLDLGDDEKDPDLTEYFERAKTEIWDENTP